MNKLKALRELRNLINRDSGVLGIAFADLIDPLTGQVLLEAGDRITREHVPLLASFIYDHSGPHEWFEGRDIVSDSVIFSAVGLDEINAELRKISLLRGDEYDRR